jgi:hypothetical protein
MPRIRERFNHRFVTKNLSAYIDDRLSERQTRRLERHLAECAACRRDLASLQRTVRALRRAPTHPVPRSFALPLSVQQEQTSYRRWNMAYGALRAVSVAVAFLLILFLSGDILMARGVIPIPDRAGAQPAELAQVEKVVSETVVVEKVVEAEEPATEATVLGTQPAMAPRALPREGLGGGPESAYAPPAAAAMESAPPDDAERPMAARASAPDADDAGGAAVGRAGARTRGYGAGAPSPEGATAAAFVPQVAGGEPVEEEVQASALEEIATASLPTATSAKVAAQITPSTGQTHGTPLDVGVHETEGRGLAPMWRLWRTLRVLSLAAFGLLLILVAALVLAGRQRRV